MLFFKLYQSHESLAVLSRNMFFSKVAVVAFAALVSVQADPDWSQADVRVFSA